MQGVIAYIEHPLSQSGTRECIGVPSQENQPWQEHLRHLGDGSQPRERFARQAWIEHGEGFALRFRHLIQPADQGNKTNFSSGFKLEVLMRRTMEGDSAHQEAIFRQAVGTKRVHGGQAPI
jgi:hypothetical protein